MFLLEFKLPVRLIRFLFSDLVPYVSEVKLGLKVLYESTVPMFGI